VVYDPSKEVAPVSFKLSQFSVASWWTQNHVSSLKTLGPQLERVTTFAITTGGEVVAGEHEITLKSAELTGHWISEAKFRLIIIFLWIISMLAYLFIAWRHSRDDLRVSVQLREQLREINESLELRVNQRTRELANTNLQLIESMKNLDGAAKLIQTEKMASLGQLVANVAHEINTPIGAIKSSGATIADALQQTLATLPGLFQVLNDSEQALFIELVSYARTQNYLLNTREERALTRELGSLLEQHQINNVRNAASTLVRLRVHQDYQHYLPLLLHSESEYILKTAAGIAAIISSADNINIAVESVTKIIFALKTFSRISTSEEMQEANLQDGLETVLTIYHNQIKQGTEVVRNFQAIPPLLCRQDELIQVWTNLIHNALQAMHYQGTLSLSITQQENTAVVTISDTGSGIAEDVLDKILILFHDQTSRRR